jgi:hypothetical protein
LDYKKGVRVFPLSDRAFGTPEITSIRSHEISPHACIRLIGLRATSPKMRAFSGPHSYFVYIREQVTATVSKQQQVCAATGIPSLGSLQQGGTASRQRNPDYRDEGRLNRKMPVLKT